MIFLLVLCGFSLLATALTSGFSALLFMLGDAVPAKVFAWFAAGAGLLFMICFLLLVFMHIGGQILGPVPFPEELHEELHEENENHENEE